MRTLLYILLHEAKNQILRLKRRPGMLVLYLFFAALIAFSFISASGGLPGVQQGRMDLAWFKLIFLGYVLLFAVVAVQTGLKSAGNLFFMCDVNFLFVAPLNPKAILMFSVLKQAARSLFAGFFILMMGNTLSSVWGIGAGGLLLVFVAYTLSLMLSQVLTVIIYLFTNGNPAAKKVVVVAGLLLLLPTVAVVMAPVLGGTPANQAISVAMNSPVLYTLPLFGWVTQGLLGLLSGNMAQFALSLGLVLAGMALMAFLLLKARPDYYEDVLVTAETGWQRQQAMKEGNLESMQVSGRKVKVGKTTQLWGRGASVFLGKHMVENFRKNPLKVLDISAIVYVAVALVMAIVQGGQAGLLMVAVTLLSMKTFLIGTGHGLRELYMHYIYIIPEPSFSKLLWSNMETCAKAFIESILAFGIAGIIMKSPPAEVAAYILLSTLFSMVLVAANLLSKRIFKDVISQGLLLTLYLVFIMVIMLPGIVLALLCSMFLPFGGTWLPVLALCLWEAFLTAVMLYLSRGVLDTSDMDSMPRSAK